MRCIRTGKVTVLCPLPNCIPLRAVLKVLKVRFGSGFLFFLVAGLALLTGFMLQICICACIPTDTLGLLMHLWPMVGKIKLIFCTLRLVLHDISVYFRNSFLKILSSSFFSLILLPETCPVRVCVHMRVCACVRADVCLVKI